MQNGVASSLILASASPRRAELLRKAGIAFRVEVSNLEEAREPGETPRTYAERLARDKARVDAIQGGAGRWVEKIEGDYENVVGLPVVLVQGMLRAANLL